MQHINRITTLMLSLGFLWFYSAPSLCARPIQVISNRLIANSLIAYRPTNAAHHAASRADSIDQLAVDASLEPDGSLQIEEKIAVNFNDYNRHGISRSIAKEYLFRGKKFPLKAEFYSVTENGNAACPHEVSEDKYQTSLHIGTSRKIAAGRHNYTIRYRLVGAVVTDKKKPAVIYWHATGSWPFKTNAVSVNLKVPKAAIVLRSDAYIEGSPKQIVVNQTGENISFKTSDLSPNSGVLYAANFNPGGLPLSTANSMSLLHMPKMAEVKQFVRQYWWVIALFIFVMIWMMRSIAGCTCCCGYPCRCSCGCGPGCGCSRAYGSRYSGWGYGYGYHPVRDAMWGVAEVATDGAAGAAEGITSAISDIVGGSGGGSW